MLNQGVSIQNVSSVKLSIKQESFPLGGVPFVIEINNRWASISYDSSRDLVFAAGIGIGMDILYRLNNPELEDNYSVGMNVKTYFNDLSKHKFFIHSKTNKFIRFRSMA